MLVICNRSLAIKNYINTVESANAAGGRKTTVRYRYFIHDLLKSYINSLCNDKEVIWRNLKLLNEKSN